MSKKMLVKNGCKYMVKGIWFSSGDTVLVDDGVTSPNLVPIPKVLKRVATKKAYSEL